MKKMLLRTIGLAVFIFAVVGAITLFKGNDNLLTGASVTDVSKIVQDTTDTIKDVDQKTGITDTIKNKANELLGNVDTNDLIQKIIDLRKLSIENNMVDIASKVTEINNEIQSINNPSINTNWQLIVGCIYEECSDDNYLAIIDSASVNDFKGTKEVIHSIIETYNFWDGKNVIYFSESLKNTDSLVKGLDNKKANTAWSEVVKCNAKCDDFSDQIFNLIEIINKQ